MSEEEKEAIETIKLLKIGIEKINAFGKFLNTFVTDNEKVILDMEDIKAIDIVLNLIDKQQKEIEELKTITREYEAYKVGKSDRIVIASKEYFINGFFKDFLNGYVSKDKLKAKIKELKAIGKYTIDHTDAYLEQESIDLLEELIGEKE